MSRCYARLFYFLFHTSPKKGQGAISLSSKKLRGLQRVILDERHYVATSSKNFGKIWLLSAHKPLMHIPWKMRKNLKVIFHFFGGGEKQTWISHATWMQRLTQLHRLTPLMTIYHQCWRSYVSGAMIMWYMQKIMFVYDDLLFSLFCGFRSDCHIPVELYGIRWSFTAVGMRKTIVDKQEKGQITRRRTPFSHAPCPAHITSPCVGRGVRYGRCKSTASTVPRARTIVALLGGCFALSVPGLSDMTLRFEKMMIKTVKRTHPTWWRWSWASGFLVQHCCDYHKAYHGPCSD